MDRASGSGVFARDPDAMLDLVELELTPEIVEQQANAAAARACLQWIKKNEPTLRDKLSQDDTCSAASLERIIRDNVPIWIYDVAREEAQQARSAAAGFTGWRIEGTLREFPKFPPVNLWFRYPVHQLDDGQILGDLDVDGSQPNWKKANRNRKKSSDEYRRSKAQEYSEAIANCCAGEAPTVNDLIQYFAGNGKEAKADTVRKDLKKFGFCINRNDGKIYKAESSEQDGIGNL